MTIGKNYEMANANIPESCSELLRQRDEAVRRLGDVSIQLNNITFEYNETIIEIMSINKAIKEAQ